MLWVIFVILVILWVLGLVSGYTMGGVVHVLPLIAQQGEIKDGKKGALQVQPGTAAKPSFNQASAQRWIDGQSAKDLIARCKEARVKTVAGGAALRGCPG